MVSVEVVESGERGLIKALRKFRRKVDKANVIRDCLDHRFYIKPSAKKRIANNRGGRKRRR